MDFCIVIMKVLNNYPALQERIGDVMGGKVLPLPSDKLREARAEGISEGIYEGKSTVIANMLKRCIPIEDICAIAECDIAFVKQIQAQIFK